MTPQERKAFEAMRQALTRIADEMQAWNSGGDPRSAEWPERRIRIARAALALAEEVNQQQRCAPCDDGECAIHPTSAQKR